MCSLQTSQRQSTSTQTWVDELDLRYTVSQCVTLPLQCCPALGMLVRHSTYLDAMVLEVLVAAATPAYKQTYSLVFFGDLLSNWMNFSEKAPANLCQHGLPASAHLDAPSVQQTSSAEPPAPTAGLNVATMRWLACSMCFAKD